MTKKVIAKKCKQSACSHLTVMRTLRPTHQLISARSNSACTHTCGHTVAKYSGIALLETKLMCTYDCYKY